MLKLSTFKTVIENTPLVSIDLCLIFEGKILLGKRNNQPLKGEWFTPGGRILKNETWKDCLERIAASELGLKVADSDQFRLMGVWDNFYNNSAVSDSISTHYVNLPHYMCFEQRPRVQFDEQHNDISWFDLEEVSNSIGFHLYMRKYASWLIKAGSKND
jgi:colanic acid biosynthesis protein WcaH